MELASAQFRFGGQLRMADACRYAAEAVRHDPGSLDLQRRQQMIYDGSEIMIYVVAATGRRPDDYGEFLRREYTSPPLVLMSEIYQQFKSKFPERLAQTNTPLQLLPPPTAAPTEIEIASPAEYLGTDADTLTGPGTVQGFTDGSIRFVAERTYLDAGNCRDLAIDEPWLSARLSGLSFSVGNGNRIVVDEPDAQQWRAWVSRLGRV